MNLLFDTNIILFIIRDKSSSKALLKLINPEEKSLFISIVSVAELYSIAFQNRWNSMQLEKLEAFLNGIQIVMVDDFLTETYMQIDSFSQRKHPDFQTYSFTTPRNMGKNDVWIAATASLLEMKLITSDMDFNHLANHFITLQYYTADQIKALIV